MSIKQCEICEKEIVLPPYRIKQGRGRYCSRQCCGIAKIGKQAWNKNRKFPKFSNERNHEWKGDNASLVAIHNWVLRYKGAPIKCEICGKQYPPIHGRRFIHWANKDHTYKRKLDDYIAMCVVCHRKYDKSYFNLHPHLHIHKNY